jgi:hypothetical protein
LRSAPFLAHGGQLADHIFQIKQRLGDREQLILE